MIDGGSTDNTLQIAKNNFKNARIISESDRGIYDAMNKGVRLGSEEIVGILNSDDFYASSEVLAHVSEVFENQEIEACYGDLVYVKEVSDPNCQIIKNRGGGEILRYWRSGPFHPRNFKWGWMPPHPTFFVRRRVYEKYGLFNLDLGSAADYELMLRFLYKHRIKVAYIPEVLVCMRAGGVSNASLKNRLKANRMDRKAWEINGLTPYPWTTMLKPIRKIPQYFRKPKNFEIQI